MRIRLRTVHDCLFVLKNFGEDTGLRRRALIRISDIGRGDREAIQRVTEIVEHSNRDPAWLRAEAASALSRMTRGGEITIDRCLGWLDSRSSNPALAHQAYTVLAYIAMWERAADILLAIAPEHSPEYRYSYADRYGLGGGFVEDSVAENITHMSP